MVGISKYRKEGLIFILLSIFLATSVFGTSAYAKETDVDANYAKGQVIIVFNSQKDEQINSIKKYKVFDS